ncbi:branched-chain amino acid ABC transporter permease [Pseudonocardia sp. WMMC193]|uniref:branched-chain amino acid ABC transporter permease n=1 Tax=Pseudonocardia sp. WMMC193 TaxID=2911965 RepID=UPI001F345EE5|nr:branched-chain amino acid ABC transporter permease [Pseudonocardia sp. WMMC193]MCF7551544.1 branched-chain amino acid ABC transporter permease [Pseudonocardia sp. WMMC193]
MSRLRSLGVPAALFAAVVAVALLATLGPSAVERLAVTGLVNLILVIGLYVFVGNSGVWSFGHMSFALVGGYVAGLLALPTRLKGQLLPDAPALVRELTAPPFVAVLVGGSVAAVVAVAVAVPLARISGLSAGLATVSLLIACSVVAAQWQSVTRGQKGLSSIPTSTTLWTALGWVLVALVLAWGYQRSSFGVRLRASKSDEVAAAAAGISVPVQRGIAFVLSAFLTGVGGALFALQLGSINPDVFYLDATFLIITMLVLGGAGSLTGAVTGGVVVSVLAEVLRRVEGGSLFGMDVPARPGLADVVLGVVLVVMLLCRPSGLTGGRELRLTRRGTGRGDPTREPSGRLTPVGAAGGPGEDRS